jgi:hypothetical protein
MNNQHYDITPGFLAAKIDHVEERLTGIFERTYDLIELMNARLKVLEAVVSSPPASNTRSST